MTIAAGFRCLDGILVGADSRLESGDVKYDEDKTFIVPSKRSDFIVVVTGSGDFEAIQHCVYLLDGSFFKQCDGSLSSVADRKSTRLNSSHRCISYAVFCLKKKT